MADGVDSCRTNRSLHRFIRRYITRSRINFLNCGHQQIGVDHCGSSAILIGLELLRMLKSGFIMKSLIFPTNLKGQLIKSLHQYPSDKQTSGPSNIQINTDLLICPKCRSNFRSKGSRRFKCHLAICLKRE